MLSGCAWIVFRHGAIDFASSEGSISPAAVAPMSSSTSGSFGCTGVPVIRCQKTVRDRTFAGSVDHGIAAVVLVLPTVSGVAAIVGSVLWTMFLSSYVPGTLALIGSPLPDVL